ncbi:MAG: hypothetical protein FJX29_09215 [Alphaproteobacteria bacterium]|nr:hypothetical protein [Alphaproteobacteria bacterium]
MRADGARRSLRCDRSSISIARKVRGIQMNLNVPARSYFGVVLSVLADGQGAPFYRISMPHADPDLAICLYESSSDEDIVAIWKAWANYFQLPKLLEREAGELESGEAWLGHVALGAAHKWRRRGSQLRKRRSRMSARRRTGDLSRMGQMHAGEREIIARN